MESYEQEAAYRDLIARWSEIVDDDPPRANALDDQIRAMGGKLRESEDGRGVLRRLLHDADSTVRLGAAEAALDLLPEAPDVLRAIRDDETDPNALSAKYILMQHEIG